MSTDEAPSWREDFFDIKESKLDYVLAGAACVLAAGGLFAYMRDQALYTNDAIDEKIAHVEEESNVLADDMRFLNEFNTVIFGPNLLQVEVITNVEEHTPQEDHFAEAASWKFTAEYEEKIAEPEFADLTLPDEMTPEYEALLEARVFYHTRLLMEMRQDKLDAIERYAGWRQNAYDGRRLLIAAITGAVAGFAAFAGTKGTRIIHKQIQRATIDIRNRRTELEDKKAFDKIAKSDLEDLRQTMLQIAKHHESDLGTSADSDTDEGTV